MYPTFKIHSAIRDTNYCVRVSDLNLALAQVSRHSFGNLTPRKKPRFWKFPGKSDLRRRVGWVCVRADTALTIRFLCFALRDSAMRRRQAVSLVGLRPPPRFRWVGQHPTFLLRLHDLGTAWHELKRVGPGSASPPTQHATQARLAQPR